MPFITKRRAAILLAPALLLILALLVIPLGYLLSFSAHEGDFATGELGELTSANYAQVLTNNFILAVAGKTFSISLLVTAVTLITAFPLAALMWRVRSFWRSPLTILVLSPLLVSMVASSYGWIVILGTNGVINNTLVSLGLVSAPIKLLYTDLAIGVGLVHTVMPFMVLSLLAALDRIEPYLSEAAAVLGANRLRIWWHVLLPLCLPGIGAGVTLVFALSISAYVTPAVLGPSGPNFITTLIYQYFVNLYEWGTGAAMALLLLATSISVVAGLGALVAWFSPTQRTAA